MGNVIVFGAGGRAGRAVVTEATTRGHRVTAVVRDPGRYAGPLGDDVRLVPGDVTEPEQVRRLSDGHDAAVSTVARLDTSAERFYTAAASALTSGLGSPGPNRLVVVGIGSNLRTPDGQVVHEGDGMPAEAREFSRGHLAGLEILQADGTGLDWVVLAPPPVFLDEADGGGPILLGDEHLPDAAATADSFSYPEVARAVLSEIETPTRHRALASLARPRAT